MTTMLEIAELEFPLTMRLNPVGIDVTVQRQKSTSAIKSISYRSGLDEFRGLSHFEAKEFPKVGFRLTDQPKDVLLTITGQDFTYVNQELFEMDSSWYHNPKQAIIELSKSSLEHCILIERPVSMKVNSLEEFGYETPTLL